MSGNQSKVPTNIERQTCVCILLFSATSSLAVVVINTIVVGSVMMMMLIHFIIDVLVLCLNSLSAEGAVKLDQSKCSLHFLEISSMHKAIKHPHECLHLCLCVCLCVWETDDEYDDLMEPNAWWFYCHAVCLHPHTRFHNEHHKSHERTHTLLFACTGTILCPFADIMMIHDIQLFMEITTVTVFLLNKKLVKTNQGS